MLGVMFSIPSCPLCCFGKMPEKGVCNLAAATSIEFYLPSNSLLLVEIPDP